MSRAPPRSDRNPSAAEILSGKPRRSLPYEFVLDALVRLSPTTKSMFGCLAVYVEEKIVMILRDRDDSPVDNGVWLATTAEHHASLRHEFPRMRSIRLFGTEATHWQVLPADAPDFEEMALRACELIRTRDPRIGKVPKRRRSSGLPRPKAKSTRKARGKARP